MSTHLINTVLDWERRLEVDEQRRREHRFEPFANNLAPVQPLVKRPSLFARLFNRRESHPVYNHPSSECCPEM